MQALQLTPLLSVTTGFLVLFIGKRLNLELPLLKRFSIPEPVSGGLLVVVLISLLHIAGGPELRFSLDSRDFLLVYFFTTVGMHARFSDLVKGGPALLILLGPTIAFMTIQNLIGVVMAALLGMKPASGLLVGTVSLIGGHGTTIAWAPTFLERFQLENAMEIGIASATFGLILASASGGPIAQLLIKRFEIPCPDVLSPTDAPQGNDVQSAEALLQGASIDVNSFLAALLAINLCIISGTLLNGWIAALGLTLPLLLILLVQLLVAVVVNLLLVFPLMGRDYDAAVICAGFGGISLGSTSTAMANMTAVTQHYGASSRAFLIVPLVSAFFLDLVNAVLIPTFIGQL